MYADDMHTDGTISLNMPNLFLLLVLLTVGNVSVRSQDNQYEKWDKEIIELANTAGDIATYSEEEKRVVLLMNLARTDGELFASTFLTGYIENHGIVRNTYVSSLYRDLEPIKNFPLLTPASDLSKIAAGHATLSGKTGHVGHKDMQKRFDPVYGNPYNSMAENCSYGYDKALDIVITLLIDDGIKSLGHRKNILNKSYTSTGVAIRAHKEWQYNCVIDFGGTGN